MNAFDVPSSGARRNRRDGPYLRNGPRSLFRTFVIPDWRTLYPAMSGEMGKPGPSEALPDGPWPPDRQLCAPGAPAPCLTAGPAVSQPPSPLAGTAEESLRRLDLYISGRAKLLTVNGSGVRPPPMWEWNIECPGATAAP